MKTLESLYWCARRNSNPRPLPSEGSALILAELRAPKPCIIAFMEDKIIDRLLSITGGAMLLNGKQVAQALGLHPTTISELKAKGLLGVPVATGTGKRDRFSVVSVAKFLLGQLQPTPPEPTQSTPDKPKRKKTPNGLPTIEQIRSMALKHFTTTLEEEATKNFEVATFLKRMVKMEELDRELSTTNTTTKKVKV